MAEQGIYKNPIFLNSVVHKSVKVAPVAGYKFARKLNSVVVVGQEFLEAAKYYPVVFTRTANEEIVPVAILGLRNNENLFVDEEGVWKEGSYVPAFFRRYPYILASNVGTGRFLCGVYRFELRGLRKERGDGAFRRRREQDRELRSGDHVSPELPVPAREHPGPGKNSSRSMSFSRMYRPTSPFRRERRSVSASS